MKATDMFSWLTGSEMGARIRAFKPELFGHLSVGQRVTIKLDASQQAIGVMETTTPELPSPSPGH